MIEFHTDGVAELVSKQAVGPFNVDLNKCSAIHWAISVSSFGMTYWNVETA